jgi:hypothetical protein
MRVEWNDEPGRVCECGEPATVKLTGEPIRFLCAGCYEQFEIETHWVGDERLLHALLALAAPPGYGGPATAEGREPDKVYADAVHGQVKQWTVKNGAGAVVGRIEKRPAPSRYLMLRPDGSRSGFAATWLHAAHAILSTEHAPEDD